ncbi:YwgA family protein [Camelliibacillus cellulosilyticus]|uniref:YwgA family protein n=1 Tax=Camelliibacillus cellulosilyticus TaxID=2174486 RepID=A0ABV9GP01_9BACL
MLEDHAKLLDLLRQAGEIVGRKKLQKILYILKKLNFPYQEKFQFHFYGPYSEELTLQIEELCNLHLIDEVREDKGGYHQYRYRLTDDGEQFLSHYEEDMPAAQSLIQLLNEQSSRFLELVATLLYFDHMPEADRKNKVKIVKQKQNYTDAEMDSALDFIAKVNQ